MRIITQGVAVVRGVGGRRGRVRRRAAERALWLWNESGGGGLQRKAERLIAAHDDGSLGKRERKRRADLRRRARDRTIAAARGMQRHHVDPWRRACELDRVRSWQLAPPWWSTPEGRARWLARDRARKLARRNPAAALEAFATACGYPAPWGPEVAAAHLRYLQGEP